MAQVHQMVGWPGTMARKRLGCVKLLGVAALCAAALAGCRREPAHVESAPRPQPLTAETALPTAEPSPTESPRPRSTLPAPTGESTPSRRPAPTSEETSSDETPLSPMEEMRERAEVLRPALESIAREAAQV